MLVSEKVHPEKIFRSEDENQQQTQPTYDTESGNDRTRATLVGGENSHQCAIPAPRMTTKAQKRTTETTYLTLPSRR